MKAGRELNALVARHVMNDVPGQVWDRAYSTDITAAWDVVEHFDARDWHAQVERHSVRGDWWASFQPWDMETPDYEIAATPALAICLAALKAVGVEVE